MILFTNAKLGLFYVNVWGIYSCFWSKNVSLLLKNNSYYLCCDRNYSPCGIFFFIFMQYKRAIMRFLSNIFVTIVLFLPSLLCLMYGNLWLQQDVEALRSHNQPGRRLFLPLSKFYYMPWQKETISPWPCAGG